MENPNDNNNTPSKVFLVELSFRPPRVTSQIVLMSDSPEAAVNRVLELCKVNGYEDIDVHLCDELNKEQVQELVSANNDTSTRH